MREFLEGLFSRTSIKPADRTKIGTHEIYIADGFVTHDQLPVIQSKFPSVIKAGKEGRDQWPSGCWATIWLTPGKIAARGGITLSSETNYDLRIKSIKEAALEELTKATRTIH